MTNRDVALATLGALGCALVMAGLALIVIGPAGSLIAAGVLLYLIAALARAVA